MATTTPHSSTRRSSASPSRTGSSSGSANNSASATSSAVSPLFPSSSWSDPLPPGPTTSDVGPFNGSPPGGGVGAGGSIQSSTKLYLYTFLATLILLLGVSSAIVFRSILLRRRHRRMVAEAIANGTWNPPAPRVRVDLRKKPRLWDAWVAPPLLSVVQGGGEKDDWDGIMPFAASYTSSPPPSSTPLSHTNASSAALSRVPTSHSSAPTTTTAQVGVGAAGVGAGEGGEELPQPRICVAVLLAMPAPGMFGAAASPSPPLSSAPANLSANPTPPPTWIPYLPALSPGDDPDEVGLPHLEVGVTSVGVVAGSGQGENEGSRGGHDEEKGADGEGRGE